MGTPRLRIDDKPVRRFDDVDEAERVAAALAGQEREPGDAEYTDEDGWTYSLTLPFGDLRYVIEIRDETGDFVDYWKE